MTKNRIITVQDVSVTVSAEDLEDYICITDTLSVQGDTRFCTSALRFCGVTVTWRTSSTPRSSALHNRKAEVQNSVGPQILYFGVWQGSGWGRTGRTPTDANEASRQKTALGACIPLYTKGIANAKSDQSRAADIIRNWLRNRSTLEYLSVWEHLYNPNFKVFESEHFKKQAGLLTFTPSVSEWVEQTGAIGLYVKRGKYGGTYAYRDIAFEFASAISPTFKLYLVKEFQRLKEEENSREQIEWDARRFLSKNNYLIQTDAVKNYLIPQSNYRENFEWLAYAAEADVLNVALFGFTAKAWRETNPELAKKYNVRDFATVNELTVLSNLETHNAQMIREGKGKKERFAILKEIAEYQLGILNAAEQIRIEEKNS